MKTIAIIPARYASTRLPGKPLIDMLGKPLIQRVVEQAQKVLDNVVVATDDERILSAVESFGGKAVMTGKDCPSGTDRCREAYEKIDHNYDVVINLQGDEPFIDPSLILQLSKAFDDPKIDIATLAVPFPQDSTFEALNNPNSPKIVLDNSGNAIYFSRSVIPYLRNEDRDTWASKHKYLKHIGVYAFRSTVLKEVTSLKQGTLEKCESLEQLRWLEAGYRIKVIETDHATIGIDTPEDMKKAINLLKNQGE